MLKLTFEVREKNNSIKQTIKNPVRHSQQTQHIVSVASIVTQMKTVEPLMSPVVAFKHTRTMAAEFS